MMRDSLCLAVFLLSALSSAQTPRIPTGTELQEALDAHNEARSETAGERAVAYMPELVWSAAAAEHGRSHFASNGCGFAHSDSYASGFGENLAAGYGSWQTAIYNGWHASEKDCYDGLPCEGGTDGHFTAVNWANTTSVGCAICEGNGVTAGVVYVCNYSPPGNFIGRDPFVEGGGTCADCSQDSARPNCVNNLCSAQDTTTPDPCDASPCANGGTCFDSTGSAAGYTCSCVTGWEGDTCEEDVDDCSPDPCENGACSDAGTNAFTCSCDSGWTGTLCNQDVDDCSPDPCENGACSDAGTNLFECSCDSGWTGDLCDEAITTTTEATTTEATTTAATTTSTMATTTEEETTTVTTEETTGTGETTSSEMTTTTSPEETESPEDACGDDEIDACGEKGDCINSSVFSDGWTCVCETDYEDPNDNKICRLGRSQRVQLIFDGVLVGDVEAALFADELIADLTLALGISEERIDSFVIVSSSPITVEIALAGELFADEPSAEELVLALSDVDIDSLVAMECLDCVESQPEVEIDESASADSGFIDPATGMPSTYVIIAIVGGALVACVTCAACVWMGRKMSKRKTYHVNDIESYGNSEMASVTSVSEPGPANSYF